jgi:hypothetical protein
MVYWLKVRAARSWAARIRVFSFSSSAGHPGGYELADYVPSHIIGVLCR